MSCEAGKQGIRQALTMFKNMQKVNELHEIFITFIYYLF